MTLHEFKAWFDGFTENVGDKGPTLKQWKRIKERVGEIDGTAVTEHIFVDRWVRPYPLWWNSYPSTPSGTWTVSNTTQSNSASGNCMFAAGQAEADGMTEEH